ncbi:MAG: hypothetical protein WDN04_06240 [Rhodospirillales bacterium]
MQNAGLILGGGLVCLIGLGATGMLLLAEQKRNQAWAHRREETVGPYLKPKSTVARRSWSPCAIASAASRRARCTACSTGRKSGASNIRCRSVGSCCACWARPRLRHCWRRA